MSQNLYEDLAAIAKFSGRRPLPDFITGGLRQSFELRPYQTVALSDFIRYFEHEELRQYPAQTLFHMATGSGKTLVMAGLMLYLYERGYRDFLFFVNSTNVLEKTRDNFLHTGSSKYLFNEVVSIGGRQVIVHEVNNFQMSEPDGINICFTTIQGLHLDLNNPRENRTTYDDFEDRRVVLISDEAHHINTLTKQGVSQSEADAERSWESTVARILASHRENVLLEFTATANLADPAIAAKYESKIVANYPLSKYREDRYSKEIKLLQADLSPLDRALQAAVLSQYRLKLFERRNLSIKPVMMLKSKTIKESAAFSVDFAEMMERLDEGGLRRLSEIAEAPVVKRAFAFFAEQDISLDLLAEELRENFTGIHCLPIDQENISPRIQIAVNTLERDDNPYRAVFAVDMLNEGWDVLNLFDIVRLHENLDAKAGKPGRSTIQEAQLIGRGARYCPFQTKPEQDAYRRKFDDDLDNEFRVCEELYYHSVANSLYIAELRTALQETGALPKQEVEVHYKLKEDFAKSDLYQRGWVFLNERRGRSRSDITELPESIRDRTFISSDASGASRTGEAFGKDVETSVKVYWTTRKFSDLPPAVLGTALRRNERLRFDRLLAVLPNLASLSEFGTSESYLGAIQLTLGTREETPTRDQWLHATEDALSQIANDLRDIALRHYGTKEFTAKPLHTVITDKKCRITDPAGDGPGVAQSAVGDKELWLNLSSLNWFGYEENYGTTEEKRFLVYFNTIVDRLRSKYGLVVVLRNEGQFAIYDFDTGRPFQPDFLLILQRDKDQGYEQFQVFVEPKGGHLADKDRWKEDLLRNLEEKAVLVKFADDTHYRVWGLPFYTHDQPPALRHFSDAMDRLVDI